FPVMMALPHNEPPADHDVAHGVAVACEDHRIQQRIVGFADEVCRIDIEHEQIGASAGRDPPDAAPQRPAPASERTAIQCGSGMAIARRAQTVASAGDQPLSVLKPAQLLDRTDGYMAVRSDAE